MAQEVRIAGATYQDVPSISVPDSNNTYHSFMDVSDTTATASDVLSGKYFYTAAGEKTLGTGTGGIEGDNLGYGVSANNIVGLAIVGTATLGSESMVGSGTVGAAIVGG